MFATPCKEQATSAEQSELPNIFCWTKMGTEAGQTLDAIIKRKELERIAGNGVFAWGIGNSLGKSPSLARQCCDREVDVLFTPMKSSPKEIDVTPSEVLVWLGYCDSSGTIKYLPEHLVVTSRGGAGKRNHYALICHSEHSLMNQESTLSFSAKNVANFATGNPVGASQVTSVVKTTSVSDEVVTDYSVKFRAKFFADGFVKLALPVVMDSELLSLYQRLNNVIEPSHWLRETRQIRKLAKAKLANYEEVPVQLALLG